MPFKMAAKSLMNLATLSLLTGRMHPFKYISSYSAILRCGFFYKVGSNGIYKFPHSPTCYGDMHYIPCSRHLVLLCFVCSEDVTIFFLFMEVFNYTLWVYFCGWNYVILWRTYPDSKVDGANMGPTWVLSSPGGPHVGPINLAVRVVS